MVNNIYTRNDTMENEGLVELFSTNILSEIALPDLFHVWKWCYQNEFDIIISKSNVHCSDISCCDGVSNSQIFKAENYKKIDKICCYPSKAMGWDDICYLGHCMVNGIT